MSGRAFNPMVNAGAIITATMVDGRTRAEQFDRILDGLSSFAGRDLEVDEDVYTPAYPHHRARRAGGNLTCPLDLEDRRTHNRQLK